MEPLRRAGPGSCATSWAPSRCRATPARAARCAPIVLVNCTSVGLDGSDPFDRLPLGADDLAHYGCVVDLVYAATGTALVAAARTRGVPVVDGLELLVGRARSASSASPGGPRRWTAMRAAVRRGRSLAIVHGVILTQPVSEYIDQLRSTPDRVLAEMETHARHDGIPIVVPATGRLLQVLALSRGARRALEVGTAIGVSTLYIARGLAEGGQVVSFEVDPDRHAAAQEYLRAGRRRRPGATAASRMPGAGWPSWRASSTSPSSTASRPSTATISMPSCRCSTTAPCSSSTTC